MTAGNRPTEPIPLVAAFEAETTTTDRHRMTSLSPSASSVMASMPLSCSRLPSARPRHLHRPTPDRPRQRWDFPDNSRCDVDRSRLGWRESQTDLPGCAMAPNDRPRLSLGDVMILVATSGVSLSIYILLDNGLFSGQRYFFGLFRPSDGLDALQVISRVAGALSILLILFGGWTLILPVLPLRRYRSQWRRLSRQPGDLCLSRGRDGDGGLGRRHLRHIMAPVLAIRRPTGIVSRTSGCGLRSSTA